MPGKSAVSARPADVVYCYDGSFDGLLCCVFESFARREEPFAVWPPEREEPTLCPALGIETDPAHAARVLRGVRAKLGREAERLIKTAFLSGSGERELCILRFLHFAFPLGPGALGALGHPDVAAIRALARNVNREAEKFFGFVRFEESGGMLGAVIHPKNRLLPLLRVHFCARLPGEDFLIYDAAHGEALVYEAGQARLLHLDAPLALPTPDEKEAYFQQLWKQFYNTLSIAERRNERCRRANCPKRFWADMTELRDEGRKK